MVRNAQSIHSIAGSVADPLNVVKMNDESWHKTTCVPTGWKWTILIAIIIGIAIFYYLVLPLNWVRDLSDVGYDTIIKDLNWKGKKASLVREIRRKRYVGNVPPVYPNGWFALIESDHLKCGKVKQISALGKNFAVFRSTSGEAFVFDAYCPHLGANMAVGGIVRGDCLECPFHGWRFRGKDGQCSYVPYSEKVPDTVNAKKWPSREVNSFVFVWHHAEGEDPTYEIEHIPEVKDGRWIYRGRNDFRVNAHIQEIPENGCDVAHLNAIHSAPLTSGSNLSHLYDLTMSRVFHHEWTAVWQKCSEAGQGHKATVDLTHHVKFLNKIKFMSIDAKVSQIGPSYVELMLYSSLGPMVILQTVTPVEPLVQRVIHRIYCPLHVCLYATFTLVAESIMFQRDVMVWNHKKYEEKPRLVKEDGKISIYRRWYSQFFSANSPTFADTRDSLDW